MSYWNKSIMSCFFSNKRKLGQRNIDPGIVKLIRYGIHWCLDWPWAAVLLILKKGELKGTRRTICWICGHAEHTALLFSSAKIEITYLIQNLNYGNQHIDFSLPWFLISLYFENTVNWLSSANIKQCLLISTCLCCGSAGVHILLGPSSSWHCWLVLTWLL